MPLSRTTKPRDPIFMNDFMEKTWLDFPMNKKPGENKTIPAINIIETEDKFRIEIAAPGMSKKDFDINIENDRLTVSSNLEREEKEGDKYARREFNYASFKKEFNLPNEFIDKDKVKATYEDGVLHILLPKKEESKPNPSRNIEVK